MIARRELLAGLAVVSAWPRAAAGKTSAPDLQGIWNNASGTPLERPAAFTSLTISDADARAYEAGRRHVIEGVPGDTVGQDAAEWFQPPPPLARIRGAARTSVIVDPPDGRLPYSAGGRTALLRSLKSMDDFDGPESRPLAERCLIGFGTPAGAPMLYGPQTNGDCQIVQTADFLVIRAESNHDLRIVSLRPDVPVPEVIRPWMGLSQGRWEGDTLRVETSRFNRAEGLRSIPCGLYMSPDAQVVERFRRTSRSEILYAFEVDDPAVFTRPWRGELLFRASRAQIYEYACHEGNYSLANVLAGARHVEQTPHGK